jgi:hypothetical protein
MSSMRLAQVSDWIVRPSASHTATQFPPLARMTAQRSCPWVLSTCTIAIASRRVCRRLTAVKPHSPTSGYHLSLLYSLYAKAPKQTRTGRESGGALDCGSDHRLGAISREESARQSARLAGRLQGWQGARGEPVAGPPSRHREESRQSPVEPPTRLSRLRRQSRGNFLHNVFYCLPLGDGSRSLQLRGSLRIPLSEPPESLLCADDRPAPVVLSNEQRCDAGGGNALQAAPSQGLYDLIRRTGWSAHDLQVLLGSFNNAHAHKGVVQDLSTAGSSPDAAPARDPGLSKRVPDLLETGQGVLHAREDVRRRLRQARDRRAALQPRDLYGIT